MSIKDPGHSGTIALVAVFALLFAVGAIGWRISLRPLTTIGVGAVLEARLGCATPSASRDHALIAARFDRLRIDSRVTAIDDRTLRVELARDPGEEVLRAMVIRGALTISEVLAQGGAAASAEALEPLRARAPGGTRMVVSCEGGACRALYVRTPSAVQAADVMSAQVIEDLESGAPRVSIALSPTGARALEALTATAAPRRIAIAIDDRVMSTPVIEEPIRGGYAAISLRGTEHAHETARGLALALSTQPLDCAGWRIESLQRL